MGNKFSVAEQIFQAVDSLAIPNTTVCDLFAGSGVVSARLAKNYDVISSDIQEYSRILVEAQALSHHANLGNLKDMLYSARLLANEWSSKSSQISEIDKESIHHAINGNVEPLANMLELSSPDVIRRSQEALTDRQLEILAAVSNLPDSAILTFAYGGLYFSYQQALDLDALANSIWNLEATERIVGLAALLSTASDIVTSVGGHFAQPINPRDRTGKSKHSQLIRAAVRRQVSAFDRYEIWLDRYLRLPASPYKVMAKKQDYRETLRDLDSGTSVIYADPPYTRDHYSRFYHVLETIALGDRPELSTMSSNVQTVTKGAYRNDRHQSPFSIISQVESAFTHLYSVGQRLGAAVVTSYSPSTVTTKARARPRLMTVEQLHSIANEYFNDVTIKIVNDRSHSKFNKIELNGPVDPGAEILLIATDPKPLYKY